MVITIGICPVPVPKGPLRHRSGRPAVKIHSSRAQGSGEDCFRPRQRSRHRSVPEGPGRFPDQGRQAPYPQKLQILLVRLFEGKDELFYPINTQNAKLLHRCDLNSMAGVEKGMMHNFYVIEIIFAAWGRHNHQVWSLAGGKTSKASINKDQPR